MCYDISYLTKRQIDYAKRYGGEEDVADIKKRLPAVYHTNGFQHQAVPVITENEGWQTFDWGLIPFWVKNTKDATDISNKTLNARGETMFEKPSFRKAAKSRRCLVVVDGFFESHHNDSKTYPYFISHKENEPFSLGGIWEEWDDMDEGEVKFTFSIVTTSANSRMEFIHNNPKVLQRGGPRMPLILEKDVEGQWLDSTQEIENIKKLIRPYPVEKLKDHTVRTLRGKNSVGNVPEAVEYFRYDELESDQASLF